MIYLTCHLESLWFSNAYLMNSADPLCDWWTYFTDMEGKWWCLQDLVPSVGYTYFNAEATTFPAGV